MPNLAELDIIKQCPNYDTITNFNYDKSDTLSKYLIRDYRDFIFTTLNKDDDFFKKAKVYDKILNIYILDKYFYKYIKSKYENDLSNNFESDTFKYLKDSYEEYENDKLASTQKSKWL